jgi:hypothetical protein
MQYPGAMPKGISKFRIFVTRCINFIKFIINKILSIFRWSNANHSKNHHQTKSKNKFIPFSPRVIEDRKNAEAFDATIKEMGDKIISKHVHRGKR